MTATATATPVTYSVASSMMGTTRTVTERNGVSIIRIDFTLSETLNETEAQDHAERSFSIEDSGVYVTRQYSAERWNAHASFLFSGDHDAAVEFAEKAFIGTPNWNQLLRETEALQDARDAGYLNGHFYN
jgi:hypothetical protein